MELTYPKCHASMRNYERNGVHVDQCTECRGIFLDRGELERLVDAENAWHGSAAQAPAAPPAAQQQRPSASQLGGIVQDVLRQAGGHQQGHQQGHYGQSHGYGQPRRKKSFLDDLFG